MPPPPPCHHSSYIMKDLTSESSVVVSAALQVSYSTCCPTQASRMSHHHSACADAGLQPKGGQLQHGFHSNRHTEQVTLRPTGCRSQLPPAQHQLPQEGPTSKGTLRQACSSTCPTVWLPREPGLYCRLSTATLTCTPHGMTTS